MTVPADTGSLARQAWDVIVVGTGMGGATLGHAMAQQGKRVLFLEQGRARSTAHSLLGGYPEAALPGSADREPTADELAHAGRWSQAMLRSGRRTVRFVPFIGSGTGGSSSLYGMALERFSPGDFQPGESHRGPADASLEPAWPISYDELAPHYRAAEALYRVRGSADPLRRPEALPALLQPPPALTQGGSALHRFLEDRGLHPYRLPQACEYVEGCRGCQGFLCDRDCKNDSERICLRPALRDHGATLLDECAVTHLEADSTRVTGVAVERRGERALFRGKLVVLAAGALATPGILLRSRNASWPDGVANRSGHVGRNLMRHFIDLYVLEPFDPGPLAGAGLKELAFNDFYVHDGVKLGSVQSFGQLPPPRMLLASLKHDVRAGPLPWLANVLPLATPFIRPVLEKMVHGGPVLATIVEDLPYARNRIHWTGAQGLPCIDYTVASADRLRIRRLRSLMAHVLKPHRHRLVKQADNNERIAHACGTCRFGSDPARSVLDRDNRAHGLDNLYVVDASFFPSSGGTNPALTIAANALRVAGRLA